MSIRIVSFVCILLGILMLAYSGFHYATTETLVDVGPVHIARDRDHLVSWPPIVGVILVAVGVVGAVLGPRRVRN